MSMVFTIGYVLLLIHYLCVIVCRIVLCKSAYLLYIKRETSYNYSQINIKNIDSKH